METRYTYWTMDAEGRPQEVVCSPARATRAEAEADAVADAREMREREGVDTVDLPHTYEHARAVLDEAAWDRHYYSGITEIEVPA